MRPAYLTGEMKRRFDWKCLLHWAQNNAFSDSDVKILRLRYKQWARTCLVSKIHHHPHTHTTLGWTPLYKWSARRRDLYLTTHNTHNRLTSMLPPPVGFEPTVPAIERPQTYALDRAATGTATSDCTSACF